MTDLAEVFPVIFYLVAALSCLTTMTRMIEDHRSEIGTLKAIGYSNLAISTKYIGYTFLASFTGGIIGVIWGSLLVPKLAFTAWLGQYTLPNLIYHNEAPTYIISVAIAVIGITGTAFLACRAELASMPAVLMRPKAPRSGKRILLERITFIWNKLKFSSKVSARNLFRYKQRLFMTVFGITGCTALLVVGFGLYDAIYAILDKQFDEITKYDATLAIESDIKEKDLKEIESTLSSAKIVKEYSMVFSALTEVKNDRNADTKTVSNVYLTGISKPENISDYITLRHRKRRETVIFPKASVKGSVADALFTEKLADSLKLRKGDTASVKVSDDETIKLRVSDIIENYVNNYIYLDINDLDRLLKDGGTPNEFMFIYEDDAADKDIDSLSTRLVGLDGASSYTYIRSTADRFEKSLSAVNAAVGIIIVAAATLAFIVLYNLTNINITERNRELATLKVLGYTDFETTNYVYRENFVMTGIGILTGLLA